MIGLGLVLSAAGSIYTGVSKLKAANSMASDLRTEGELIYQESIRTADIIIEESTKFAASQSLQYIGSGVQLMGSALITIAQTKKYAEAEAAAVKAQGAAAKYKADTTASRTENEGRASLVSGIFGAGGSLLSGAD